MNGISELSTEKKYSASSKQTLFRKKNKLLKNLVKLEFSNSSNLTVKVFQEDQIKHENNESISNNLLTNSKKENNQEKPIDNSNNNENKVVNSSDFDEDD